MSPLNYVYYKLIYEEIFAHKKTHKYFIRLKFVPRHILKFQISLRKTVVN